MRLIYGAIILFVSMLLAFKIYCDAFSRLLLTFAKEGYKYVQSEDDTITNKNPCSVFILFAIPGLNILFALIVYFLILINKTKIINMIFIRGELEPLSIAEKEEFEADPTLNKALEFSIRATRNKNND